ncbi:MAG: hypothetical protein R3Y28_00565 [Candidatus Gastranaerophilales bacterium]
MNKNTSLNYELIGSSLTEIEKNNSTIALNLLSEFFDVQTCVLTKDNKVCAVSLAKTLQEAYKKVMDSDGINMFGGVLGFSQVIDLNLAKFLISSSPAIVIAPDFSEDALECLKAKNNIKLIKLDTALSDYKNILKNCETISPFGIEINGNMNELQKDTFAVVTKKKPNSEEVEDAIFAWKVAKHTKSLAIVVAKDFQTKAVISSNNLLDGTAQALDLACEGSKEAILAFDDLIDFEECILSAIQTRISLIIQSGGSVNENKLIEICDKYDVAMITTGIKNLC